MDPTMYHLDSKSAIVTGAAHGIGRRIALRLAEEGCDIGIFDIDEAEAQKTASDIRARGVRVFVEKGNVAHKGDVNRAMSALMRGLGRVDILVNNAGTLRVGKILAMSEKDWDDTFRVNLDSVFFVSRSVIPHMISRKSGCVLNLASWLGKKGVASYGAYCASKFAVIGLTQTMAVELAEYGIRVNALAPGLIVDTKLRAESEAMHQAQGLPLAAERAKAIPLGRVGYPDDVARLAAFLVSDEAAYMTGQAVNVSGGLWMN
jgi:NAD(P)-dependent dehydrogenase (short-subunit alcohol dehydrogenase family)